MSAVTARCGMRARNSACTWTVGARPHGAKSSGPRGAGFQMTTRAVPCFWYRGRSPRIQPARYRDVVADRRIADVLRIGKNVSCVFCCALGALVCPASERPAAHGCLSEDGGNWPDAQISSPGRHYAATTMAGPAGRPNADSSRRVNRLGLLRQVGRLRRAAVQPVQDVCGRDHPHPCIVASQCIRQHRHVRQRQRRGSRAHLGRQTRTAAWIAGVAGQKLTGGGR